MKNYDEIANRIFERRDEYIAKRQKKRIIISVVVTEICCLVVLIAGFALWKIGIFSNNIPAVNYTQNTSNNLSSDSSVNSSKNTSTNSSNSSKDNNSASTPPNDSSSQGGFISENNTPSNNSSQGGSIPDNIISSNNSSSQDDFVFEDKTPSIPDDKTPSNPSDNTSSNISSSNPNAIETNYYIDSIDKINFYSAKKIISEKSLLPIGMNCNYNPNIISLSKVYAEYPIDRNKVFTITMATYFTIELNDEKGFLAQKLGGTGIVEVVVTENDIDVMGQMITFKREEKYYTCFANGGDYDPDSNKRSREFSSHKYIVGFNIVKNLEQENYKFTVHYDGSKVIGFECAPFHSVPTNYVVDDVTFIEDFCVVIYAKQTFTIDELEVYFKNENVGETLWKETKNSLRFSQRVF